ncbi:hypothetical protein E2C01_038181 [Portunus trituberculatus]|uniref:Uncharacterized protein n=1 Tax=Portunus trituberculatus TaxID=210409 RepID=A0A5B7FHU3_PORTR|nr:hypothetical protein [Portunus trituberculatus]
MKSRRLESKRDRQDTLKPSSHEVWTAGKDSKRRQIALRTEDMRIPLSALRKARILGFWARQKRDECVNEKTENETSFCT